MGCWNYFEVACLEDDDMLFACTYYLVMLYVLRLESPSEHLRSGRDRFIHSNVIIHIFEFYYYLLTKCCPLRDSVSHFG